MSKPRSFLSYATVCSAALMAVRLAVWMFPMQAPAQTAAMGKAPAITADGPGVVVEPGAKILHRSSVFFPRGVTVSGNVVVETTVNSKGEVTDARIVSGPEELRAAVLASALTWHFSPDGLPPVVQSTIRFSPPAVEEQAPARTRIADAEARFATTSYVNSINVSGPESDLTDELSQKIRAALPVHIGDEFSSDTFARVKAAMKEVDEHLVVMARVNGPNATLWVTLPPSQGTAGHLMPSSTPVAQVAATGSLPQTVRVGGNVQAMNLIKKVTPLYPPVAKQARIQGTVSFTATIDKEGNVAKLELISGHPLLVQSAQDAVQQWQYKPTLLNGQPVSVITVIEVNYTLTE